MDCFISPVIRLLLKGGLMKKSFDRWAVEQIKERVRCRVERSMTCLPLKGDPICSACYEADKEDATSERSRAEKKR
ncbi:MAG: hypothetical protein HY805_00200 [Nitrospirae bacterium]|nr:hypothetical protein [Nitrospirota bacterium]